MAFVDSGYLASGSVVKHRTIELAKEEANRLLNTRTTNKVYILEVVGFYTSELESPTWNQTRNE